MSEYLLADIGGTHSRLAVLQDDTGPVHINEFDNASFPDLISLITHYIDHLPADLCPSAAVLAVAAPVEGDQISLTNINWHFSITGMRREVGLDDLFIINDFVALALAIPDLGDGDYQQLWGKSPRNDAPCAVIGPGTGLGTGILVPTGQNWLAVAGEGGHVTLPGVTEMEVSVIRALQAEFGHVSAERVLCGPGLERLYQTLARLKGNNNVEHFSAENISKMASEDTDQLARESLDIFFAMLGTVSGNLALTAGARGGIYLAGGILAQLAQELKSSNFYPRFIDKGRYRDYLSAIPVYLLTARNPALTGLCRFVKTLGK